MTAKCFCVLCVQVWHPQGPTTPHESFRICCRHAQARQNVQGIGAEARLHGVRVLAGGDALLVEAQPLLHLLPQLLPKRVCARELCEAVDPVCAQQPSHAHTHTGLNLSSPENAALRMKKSTPSNTSVPNLSPQAYQLGPGVNIPIALHRRAE